MAIRTKISRKKPHWIKIWSFPLMISSVNVTKFLIMENFIFYAVPGALIVSYHPNRIIQTGLINFTWNINTTLHLRVEEMTITDKKSNFANNKILNIKLNSMFLSSHVRVSD